MKKLHLQRTVNKTLCGVNIKNNNIVIDINHCTCKNCNKIVDNIQVKWDCVGLLDNLPEDKKSFVAYMFEEALDIMMNNEVHTDENINTLIFPIIYRVGMEINFDRDELLTFFKDLKDLLNNTEFAQLNLMNVDAEQIIVHSYSRDKIKQLKGFKY